MLPRLRLERGPAPPPPKPEQGCPSLGRRSVPVSTSAGLPARLQSPPGRGEGRPGAGLGDVPRASLVGREGCRVSRGVGTERGLRDPADGGSRPPGCQPVLPHTGLRNLCVQSVWPEFRCRRPLPLFLPPRSGDWPADAPAPRKRLHHLPGRVGRTFPPPWSARLGRMVGSGGVRREAGRESESPAVLERPGANDRVQAGGKEGPPPFCALGSGVRAGDRRNVILTALDEPLLVSQCESRRVAGGVGSPPAGGGSFSRSSAVRRPLTLFARGSERGLGVAAGGGTAAGRGLRKTR